MEREKLESERESAHVRLMEELRKDDERVSARKAERDEEIADLKKSQEKYFEELKCRETESEQIYRNELELRESEEKLKAELAKLINHENVRSERITVSYDVRRMKTHLRNVSQAVLGDLQFNTGVLERLSSLPHTNGQQIDRIREKIHSQYELELQKQRQIESMYESEAKTFYSKQQQIWQNESSDREKLIRQLIDHQIHQLNNEIDFIVARKSELNEVRESLRRAIDDSNERIKSLLGANSSDDKLRIGSANKLLRTSDLPDTIRDIDMEICLPDLFTKSTISERENNQSPLTSNRPRFGRKKVAWT